MSISKSQRAGHTIQCMTLSIAAARCGDFTPDIWFTLGPAKARQIFLGALDSKRSVREHASADLLRRYLSSGQGLGKFAATVAAECGKKAETVQAAIIRAQKRMRKDKDFEARCAF